MGFETYDNQYEWGCYTQHGSRGLVLDGAKTYFTAFFEAFPTNPDTFIRGEGKTIEEAEQAAYAEYQKILSCPQHEFERRGYKNGAGFCKHCGMFASQVFEPSEHCQVCGQPTYFTFDIDDHWYCKDHAREKPLEKFTAADWAIVEMENDSYRERGE